MRIVPGLFIKIAIALLLFPIWGAVGSAVSAALIGGLGIVEVQYSEPGLESVADLAFSPDSKYLYAAGFLDDAVGVFKRRPGDGVLFLVELQRDNQGSITDMDNPRGVIVSPDGKHVYVASYAEDAVNIFSRNQNTGALTYISRLKEGVDSIQGLNGAVQLAMDSNGSNLYVASSQTSAVAVFSRNSVTGLLTQVEVEFDPSNIKGIVSPNDILVGPGDSQVYVAGQTSDAVAVFDRSPVDGSLTWVERWKDGSDGVNGLNGISGLAISPDGAYLYTVAYEEDALAIFSRNTGTGLLTFVSYYLDDSVLEGLDGASSIAINAAGNRVYVASKDENALSVYTRNPYGGLLSDLHLFQDGISGIYGMDYVEALEISPDDESLYTASRGIDTIGIFGKDEDSGEMIFLKSLTDLPSLMGPVGSAVSPNGQRLYVTGAVASELTVFSRRPDGSLYPADREYDRVGLASVRDVAISPSGEYAYTAGHDDNAIAQFHWNTGTKNLDYQASYQDNNGSIDGLGGVQSLAMSPDGANLYAASEGENAIAVFSRSTSNGNLTYREKEVDGVGGLNGLDGAYDVVVSPNNTHVYAVGYVDDAVVVFSRDLSTGDLSYQGTIFNDPSSGAYLNGANALAFCTVDHLYVAARNSNAITFFERNFATGNLSSQGHYIDGVNGVDGLAGARGIACDPNGKYVYVASQYDDAVAIFSRSSSEGTLDYIRAERDSLPWTDGLNNADGISVSPDGLNIYVSAFDDNAISVFRWVYLDFLPLIKR